MTSTNHTSGQQNNCMSNQIFHALKNKASCEEVLGIIHSHPEALMQADEAGRLPLHYILWSKYSDDVVKILLLDANPEAAKVQAKDGSLPLHYAFPHNSSNDFIEMFITA
jgi:ankyrin repeat protein